jgi:biopolymer transport protein ExbB
MLLVFAAPAVGQEQQGTVLRVWSMFFYNHQWDFIGLIIVWLLLLLSMLCIGFALNLVMRYRRSMVLPEATYAQLQQMLEARQYRQAIEYAQGDASYLGKLMASALNQASNGYSAMERAVEETGDAETTRYLRPVEYLNVVGNIAPMMGLFGTVYGMIVAFQQLVEAGGRPDPVQLAGGISTALVTTFWGLIVAIPAMAAYALIRNKIDALTTEGLLQAEELITPFKPSGKKRPPVNAATAGPDLSAKL